MKLWLAAFLCAAACASPASRVVKPTMFLVSVSVPPAPRQGAPYIPIKDDPALFGLADVFELEWADDPQIAPDGRRVVYVRTFMDIMSDSRRRSLWAVSRAGTDHRAVVTGAGDYWSPRWSPSGDRLLFVGTRDGASQLFIRWTDSGQTTAITRLTQAPGNIAWSPDGTQVAFTMLVPAEPTPLVQLPAKPEGANWAEPPKVIDTMTYRVDGAGYLPRGFEHVFVVPADGGTPRQLTQGDFDHGRLAWTPDSRSIIVTANRKPDWEHDPIESELYRLDVASGGIAALTDRDGPDEQPSVAPDGAWMAWVGFDDGHRSAQNERLYVARLDGTERKELGALLDRAIGRPVWRRDGKGVYAMYSDHGNTKLAYFPLRGEPRVIADNVGGLQIGRPYDGGAFSVADDGTVAFTLTATDHPADVAIASPSAPERITRLTELNRDLFGHKRLAEVEEIRVPSANDALEIQAWIVKPPGADLTKKYPLILEIHGGPHANYGDRFSAEMQLYAAAGYVVVYANPRGSSSYGTDFLERIHHNYPSHDYDDLMSVVDAVVARGYVDPQQLYVTGGSGGGVLTAWIVGKTDRFRAAVVAKPVINWYSFVLTADFASYFNQYWFPGFPWDHLEHYMKRSPISLVGNVSTPTMLLSGEADYRTPIGEAEQYYQALKLLKVDTALVRIPGASHGIAHRPSHLIAKVGYVLGWFHRYAGAGAGQPAGGGDATEPSSTPVKKGGL